MADKFTVLFYFAVLFNDGVCILQIHAKDSDLVWHAYIWLQSFGLPVEGVDYLPRGEDYDVDCH